MTIKARHSNNFATRYSTIKLKPHIRFISTVIVYISLFAILYIPFQRNIRNVEISPFAASSIIWRYLASVSMIYLAFLYDKDFRRLLVGKTGILYGLFILFYTYFGFSYGNRQGHIFLDLESCLALVAGIAMFILLAKSYRPKIQLIAIIAIGTLLVCYGTYLIAIRQGIVFGDVKTRTADASIYQYFHLPIILSALGFAVFWRQNLFWKILIAGLFALNFFFVGILGASRTPVLEMLAVLIFSIFGLCYSLSNGFLTTQLSGLQAKRLFPILIFLGGIVAFFLFFEFAGQLLDFLQNTNIYQRLFNPDASTESSTNLRSQEVEALLDSLKELDWWLGKGLGGTFISPIFAAFNVWFLHIGIFTMWLKGGIILFSFFVFIFYIMFPVLFIRALLLPNDFDPGKRTAILTILPGVFGYVVLMSSTGGFQYEQIIVLGFMFGAYLHIRKYGLGIFFE